MYEAQSHNDWKHIIADSGVKVVLVPNPKVFQTVSSYIGHIGQLQHVISLEHDPANVHSIAHHLQVGAKHQVPAFKPHKNDLATIIYTSGTTVSGLFHTNKIELTF